MWDSVNGCVIVGRDRTPPREPNRAILSFAIYAALEYIRRANFGYEKTRLLLLLLQTRDDG